MRIFLIWLFGMVLFSSCGLKKNEPIVSRSIADCIGAVPILGSGRISFEMPGTYGNKQEFENYPSIRSFAELNSLWFSYVAPYDGQLFLKATSDQDNIRIVIFQTDPGRDLCLDIGTARAEIKRFLVKEPYKTVELRDSIAPNVLYPLGLKKGESIMIAVFSDGRKRSMIDLDTELIPEIKGEKVETGSGVKKLVDQRNSEKPGSFYIQLRDVETAEPVAGMIQLDGIRGLSGFYNASDLYLTPEQSGKLSINCDVPGYFFVDRKEPVNGNSQNEVTLWLEPLRSGKAIVLEEIQFVPGSSSFLETAGPKLIRLRDFMVLNPAVNIEIQGHVLEVGKTSNAGQALSEARAQMVMKYLIESGINKKRMRAVGFGGTKPIFENPKFSYQEQANRRVEIVIL